MATDKPYSDWIPQHDDLGLGLCYQGVLKLAEYEQARRSNQQRADGSIPAGFRPNFAVTLAPYPTPMGTLALPVCFGCLSGGPTACGGIEYRTSGLVAARANGGLHSG